MKFYRILSRIDATKFKGAGFAVNFAAGKILKDGILSRCKFKNSTTIKFRRDKI
ncbi:hypothetical protein [uncultured Campylobacter sp.]|uniref:hypothetical protein n=1 Tax=uncultured Campylobacter sp. TaxID=218934 RepID=UPI0026196774|nr:hypothetical protein [uncultured Campylobacter sp.]